MTPQEQIAAVIATFPATFQLKAHSGTFKISAPASYINDAGAVVLVTQKQYGADWQDFAKDTEDELRAQVWPITPSATPAEGKSNLKGANPMIEKRSECSHIDPKNIVIVGLDTPHKSIVEHSAFDPRATLPVSEEMIASLAAEGQLQPIRVYATGKGDGRQYIALNGRQRVKAARRLNELYAEQGSEKRMLMRCEIDAAPDEKRIFRVGIAENEIRIDNSLLIKIEAAATMANVHQESREAIARTFGVSLPTISLWFKFWQAPKAVKQAYADNKITFTAALKLADLPEKQCTTTLAALTNAPSEAPASQKLYFNCAECGGCYRASKDAPCTAIRDNDETPAQTNENTPSAPAAVQKTTAGEDARTAAKKGKSESKKASAADVVAAASGKTKLVGATKGEIAQLIADFDNGGEKAGITYPERELLGVAFGLEEAKGGGSGVRLSNALARLRAKK